MFSVTLPKESTLEISPVLADWTTTELSVRSVSKQDVIEVKLKDCASSEITLLLNIPVLTTSESRINLSVNMLTNNGSRKNLFQEFRKEEGKFFKQEEVVQSFQQLTQ